MSIRTRLAVAVALVLMVTLGVLGVVLVRTTRATLVDQTDDKIFAAAERVRGRADHPPYGRDRGGGPDRRGGEAGEAEPAAEPELDERPVARLVFGPGGEVRDEHLSGFPDDRDSPPRLPPIPSDALDAICDRVVTAPSVDGSLKYRMLVQRGPGGEVAVTAAPLTAVDDAISRLVQILLGVGGIALVAATAASWWLIRRGLRPVDRMVDTAAAIAAGDLSRRVVDADPRTELGRLGGALNEMLHQIEGAARAQAASEDRLRRFVADAAHELRTPLTSLRGYAELYRQGALPDEGAVANAMRRIESEGARMARLVDDLLLLARLDQHRGLETKPVDVVDLVREAVADFGVAAPEHPVTEDFVDVAVVRGDRTRLRQVVDNLLANARVHTPTGTPVRATVARTADHAEVTIADEGPGIAPNDRARVFERFWRADPARGRGRGGSGLGLAIVASLVQAHGGSVEVASDVGRGTSFTVRLPLAEQVSAPLAKPSVAVHAAPRLAPAVLAAGVGREDGSGG